MLNQLIGPNIKLTMDLFWRQKPSPFLHNSALTRQFLPSTLLPSADLQHRYKHPNTVAGIFCLLLVGTHPQSWPKKFCPMSWVPTWHTMNAYMHASHLQGWSYVSFINFSIELLCQLSRFIQLLILTKPCHLHHHHHTQFFIMMTHHNVNLTFIIWIQRISCWSSVVQFVVWF